MKKDGYIFSHSIIWFLIMIYYVLTIIAGSLTENSNFILVLNVIPVLVILVVAIFSNQGFLNIKPDIVNYYIFGFTFFCYFSAIWAENSSYAISKGNNLLVIFVLTSIVYMCMPVDENTVKNILKILMWGGYAIVIFVIVRYNWKNIISAVTTNTRINNSVLNANTIGLCASYSIIICLYFILFEGINLLNTISAVMATLSILIMGVSGSRKALLSTILAITLLLIMKNIDNRNLAKTLLKIMSIIVLIAIFFVIMSKMPIFEVTMRRIVTMMNGFRGSGNVDSSTLVRLRMVEIGQELFYRSPIIGIGMDNAQIYAGAEFNMTNFYLHNNYIEILADGGIWGFTLYYWIYLYLLINYWKFRDFQSSEFAITLIFLIIHLVMDYGMVSYETKSTYIFLVLFMSELKVMKSQRFK